MILDTIRNALGLARKVRENAAGLAAAQVAYEAGAGLEGVLVAYTAATPAGADDLVPVAVLEIVDGIYRATAASAQTLELFSQTTAGIALELRELEGLIARLRGGASLRDVLEGP